MWRGRSRKWPKRWGEEDSGELGACGCQVCMSSRMLVAVRGCVMCTELCKLLV